MNFKYRYPIGIDIREGGIYATQFKQTTRRLLAVRGFVKRDVNGEGTDEISEETLVSALKEVSQNRSFSGKKAVIHIPVKELISFPIQFELEGKETLEMAILRKSQEYLSQPIEESVIDSPSIIALSHDKSAPKYKAIVVAAPKERVAYFLDILKKAGLFLEAIDFPVCSLYRLHRYLYEVKGDPIILCHIGEGHSMISIFTREGLFAERHVPWGIQVLVKKIMSNLELSGDKKQAMLLLQRFGLINEDGHVEDDNTTAEPETMGTMYRAIHQILTPYIEELVDELHKMIGYMRSEEQSQVPEKIYIYGQGATVNYLDLYVEKRFNIPTELVSPLKRSGFDMGGVMDAHDEGGSFALSMGLAMRKVKRL
jgi:type IV pilus assembly protein PilM